MREHDDNMVAATNYTAVAIACTLRAERSVDFVARIRTLMLAKVRADDAYCYYMAYGATISADQASFAGDMLNLAIDAARCGKRIDSEDAGGSAIAALNTARSMARCIDSEVVA